MDLRSPATAATDGDSELCGGAYLIIYPAPVAAQLNLIAELHVSSRVAWLLTSVTRGNIDAPRPEHEHHHRIHPRLPAHRPSRRSGPANRTSCRRA